MRFRRVRLAGFRNMNNYQERGVKVDLHWYFTILVLT